MKRIILTLIICATTIASAGAAERIAPSFLIDTETSLYLPLSMGIESDSLLSPGYFGVAQDLTLVDPGSTVGVGARIGLEHSPIFDTLILPVHAVASIGYNMKIGAGAAAILGDSSSSLEGSPSGTVMSAMMSFSWPVAKIGPSFLGMLFGIQAYRWSYEDSWGDSYSVSQLGVSIGASLSFDPVDHPANASLYPAYTGSFD